MNITIYTDGSYSPQYGIGSWVTLIFIGGRHITLSGIEQHTSQHRMELMAILESIAYIIALQKDFNEITIITDSQYAVGLQQRMDKLIARNFRTAKGNELHNTDLLQRLSGYLDNSLIRFIKVKAHLPKTTGENYNRVADVLARKLLRNAIALLADS